MRLDKYLKVTRILKRREVGKELAKNQRVLINGKIAKPSSEIKINDEIEVILDDQVKRVYASPLIASDTGCVTLQRGPLIYCVEGVDNEQNVLSLSYVENGMVTANAISEGVLKGVISLEAEGYRTFPGKALYEMSKPKRIKCIIKAIPYYTWGNRGVNQMRVWVPEKSPVESRKMT